MGGWPYPGDWDITIAKRVAMAYRQRLLQLHPGACAALDEKMREFDQGWVIPRPITGDPEAWISAADAAELSALTMTTLRVLRRKGRLKGRPREPDGRNGAPGYEYQVKEVLALATMPRFRNREGGS